MVEILAIIERDEIGHVAIAVTGSAGCVRRAGWKPRPTFASCWSITTPPPLRRHSICGAPQGGFQRIRTGLAERALTLESSVVADTSPANAATCPRIPDSTIRHRARRPGGACHAPLPCRRAAARRGDRRANACSGAAHRVGLTDFEDMAEVAHQLHQTGCLRATRPMSSNSSSMRRPPPDTHSERSAAGGRMVDVEQRQVHGRNTQLAVRGGQQCVECVTGIRQGLEGAHDTSTSSQPAWYQSYRRSRSAAGSGAARRRWSASCFSAAVSVAAAQGLALMKKRPPQTAGAIWDRAPRRSCSPVC